MLKKRIVPVLLLKDVGLVKGEAFDSWRRVGMPMQAVKVFNTRDVDELVLLDISATPNGVEPDFDQISDLAAECFVPLTVGGGVRTVETVRKLLLAGADKVAINTAMYETPELITEAARIFGAQCVVAAIDYREVDGKPLCFSHCGTRNQGTSAIDQARRAEALGAGEILLTSIERDGKMKGLDLTVAREVVAALTIPVIVGGGAATVEDFRAALQDVGASAVAAGAIWQFTQATPREIKRQLRSMSVPVRE